MDSNSFPSTRGHDELVAVIGEQSHDNWGEAICDELDGEKPQQQEEM